MIDFKKVVDSSTGLEKAVGETTAYIKQPLVFDRVNTNGKPYAIFTAQTEGGQTVSGIVYENMADKLGLSEGSEMIIQTDVNEIINGVNNHWSPVFTSVSAVSSSDKSAAQAFLDSL